MIDGLIPSLKRMDLPAQAAVSLGRRRCARRRYGHSVAAIGPLAESIATSGGASAWDADSPMRQVLDREAVFLLLGVPYQNLTAVHLCEVEFEVPYRKLRVIEAPMRRADGSLTPLVSVGCPPEPGHPGSDFNRLGQRMEAAGLVTPGTVGNARAAATIHPGRHVRRRPDFTSAGERRIVPPGRGRRISTPGEGELP